jgi:hypothetical protein
MDCNDFDFQEGCGLALHRFLSKLLPFSLHLVLHETYHLQHKILPSKISGLLSRSQLLLSHTTCLPFYLSPSLSLWIPWKSLNWPDHEVFSVISQHCQHCANEQTSSHQQFSSTSTTRSSFQLYYHIYFTLTMQETSTAI